jgi:hypothetical protein
VSFPILITSDAPDHLCSSGTSSACFAPVSGATLRTDHADTTVRSGSRPCFSVCASFLKGMRGQQLQ